MMTDADPVLEAWDEARRAAEGHAFTLIELFAVAQNGLFGLDTRQRLHLTVERCAECEEWLLQAWNRRGPSAWVLDEVRDLASDTTLRAALTRHAQFCSHAACGAVRAPKKPPIHERVREWLDRRDLRWLPGELILKQASMSQLNRAERSLQQTPSEPARPNTRFGGAVRIEAVDGRDDQLRLIVDRRVLTEDCSLVVLVFLSTADEPLAVVRFPAGAGEQEQAIDVSREHLGSGKLRVVLATPDG
jgi:hypothetical protein